MIGKIIGMVIGAVIVTSILSTIVTFLFLVDIKLDCEKQYNVERCELGEVVYKPVEPK